ncbi:unnamed protein product [Ceratitis capitata]|uniref:(Mediterranean fruit fly) hypothetical protein n=1 Tax=Ceratitis capitata TaxID=7213 RepID=A0A811UUQ9_CERCA|nr:unnamed protein product [Ceratitis capitata]
MEDWTSLGQHKRHPEFPVVIENPATPREKPRGSPVIARCSPVPLQRLRRSPTLGIGVRNGTLRSESEVRGTLRFLPQLEMRPSSNAPNPVECREAPPTSSFPDFSEPP